MINTSRAGTKGEVLAKEYLLGKGYEIVCENYTVRGCGEIDLIALDGKELVFTEIKYRENDRYGHPLEAIGREKRRKLIKAAGSFLGECTVKHSGVRFDVIGITGEKIEHIENAFWARWN